MPVDNPNDQNMNPEEIVVHQPPKKFSIFEAIKIGFDLTFDNFGFLVGIFFLTLGIEFGLSIILSDFFSRIPLLGLLFQLAHLGISFLISIGHIIIYLNLYDNKPRSIWDLFSGTDLIFKFIGVSFIVGFSSAIGSFFFIIPGLIIAFLLMFAPIIVIDQQVRVRDSLSSSFSLVKNNFAPLLGLVITIAIVNIVGALLFGVGLLITTPATIFAWIHAYRIFSTYND